VNRHDPVLACRAHVCRYEGNRRDGAPRRLRDRIAAAEPETASCIEEVARRKLRMPPSEDGGTSRIVYPFILR